MCGILGIVVQNMDSRHIPLLYRLFLESSIRGLHATGLSYVKSGKIWTETHPVPATQFPFAWDQYTHEDGNLYLLGHCRYSTSDLAFNQPLANEQRSIVHNGVVSQELPEHWESLYGYVCQTKNDSELILRTLEAGHSPLQVWANSSLAVCELRASAELRAYRNGKRPLYLIQTPGMVLVTSTADIARRAGLSHEPARRIPMNTVVTITGELSPHFAMPEPTTLRDLQYATGH